MMSRPGGAGFAAIVAFLAGTLLCAAGAARADVLFEKHFGEAARKAGKQVEGEYVDGYAPKRAMSSDRIRQRAADPLGYPVVLGNQVKAPAGSFVVRMKYEARRQVRKDWADISDTVFALMNDKGKYILTVNVVWPDAVPPWFLGGGMGGLELSSETAPPSVWGGWIPFDRRIKPGDWITLALTWDNTTTRAYLNGTQLTERYKSGGDTNGKLIPTGAFGNYISNLKYLQIGSDNQAKGSNNPLISGALGGFEIHDRALAFFASASKPVITRISDDSFKVPGISGKLVAGDTVNVELAAIPGGRASFDMGKVKGIPLSEAGAADVGGGGSASGNIGSSRGAPAATDNGTYRGSYTIRPGDDFENGRIVGYFVSADNVAADNAVSESKWTIDTRPRVAFSIDKTDLPADQKSTSRVKLSAKDANGNPIKGRRLKLTLATTDEYTGLVGSGTARTREIAAAVKASLAGAEVETRWRGETDSWGEVEFDYTSGFAAKTVILQVKDLESGATAVDYITSYKEASIDIALTPPVSMAAARRGLMYYMKIEATRTELTADGRSRSVIRASVFDPSGKPVAGDAVLFALSSPNGSLRTIAGTTDASGVAVAEYTAGKKIGIVVVTATDTVRNVSASVSITLLSDAPAKIYLAAKPTSLPANGMSRADINVKVTDINDNPNDNTKVEFRIASGGGKLDYPERVTDKFGETTEKYTAGTSAGIARIVATVRSKVPTESELGKAQNVLYAPWSDAGEDIRISQWLKRKGETALAGEPVVEYTIGRGGATYRLNAPYDCRIDFQYVEYWDYAQTGDTLALITPVVVPGSQSPAPPSTPKQSPRRR